MAKGRKDTLAGAGNDIGSLKGEKGAGVCKN